MRMSARNHCEPDVHCLTPKPHVLDVRLTTFSVVMVMRAAWPVCELVSAHRCVPSSFERGQLVANATSTSSTLIPQTAPAQLRRPERRDVLCE